MIQELLISAINETATYNYVITEFRLGEEPMRILLRECEGISNQPTSTVKKYMGIPVVEHESKDAVMFGIKVAELRHSINYVSPNEFDSVIVSMATMDEPSQWKEATLEEAERAKIAYDKWKLDNNKK